MFHSLINTAAIIMSANLPSAESNSPKQSQQFYLAPFFEDSDRLTKIQAIFPEIDRMYREYAETNHFPGYAYGILLDGKLVCTGSGGFIDLDKKTPASPKAMFRIASMTKSFTAMAILKLRDEGKLKLDDPVALYIPEMQHQRLTQDAPEITIRDLLMHSSGLPTDDPWGDRKLDDTDEELISLVKKGITFSNSTGSLFEYSNMGYALLGYVIKKITGISCGDYIESEICRPAGMSESSWEFTEVSDSQLAHGYRWSSEKWKEEELLGDGTFGAMGGLITSIESFSHYAALHQSAWPLALVFSVCAILLGGSLSDIVEDCQALAVIGTSCRSME